MELQASGETFRKARDLAKAGDYDQAVAIATTARPGMGSQLEQYRVQMQMYEAARLTAEWRQALRALVDARSAALAAGVPELEEVVCDQLYALAKRHEGRPA